MKTKENAQKTKTGERASEKLVRVNGYLMEQEAGVKFIEMYDALYTCLNVLEDVPQGVDLFIQGTYAKVVAALTLAEKIIIYDPIKKEAQVAKKHDYAVHPRKSAGNSRPAAPGSQARKQTKEKA